MSDHRRHVSRRQFLRQTAASAGALAVGGRTIARAVQSAVTLPAPAESGIDHVIVLMMENRSYDHYFGWIKKADGRQEGLAYPDTAGVLHPTMRLAPDFQGCGHPDPDHSYAGGRIEFNGGACDGWLRAGTNDDYAIGYYTDADLAFFDKAAPDWTVCDRYFSSIMAPTFPNRFYMHAAQTDRLDNSTGLSTLPTIWDRLLQAGIDGRYYFSDVPFLAFWGAQYLPISRPFDAFLADCAANTLPAVAFVDPRFVGEDQGLSNDDHPHADIRNGEAFINQVYEAVVSSPAWARTVLVITYDEWGGFFDHVPPPIAAVPPADAMLGSDGRLGFRVPSLVVSPIGAKKNIASDTLDHTSILRMIEWRWGLAPLTVRDQNAVNLAEVLDFGSHKLHAAHYNVPASATPTPCVTAATIAENEWTDVQAIARVWGWPL
jgi:phospholipase C